MLSFPALRSLGLALALLGTTAILSAQDLHWGSDFAAAQAESARLHKPLLIDFTGSDWCIYCKKLEAQVMTTGQFQKFADQYVLVRVDFLRHHPQDDAVKQANQALAQRYGIQGFPTLIVADATGKELHRVEGYDPSTDAGAYLSQFK